jgi:hypothetical protein
MMWISTFYWTVIRTLLLWSHYLLLYLLLLDFLSLTIGLVQINPGHMQFSSLYSHSKALITRLVSWVNPGFGFTNREQLVPKHSLKTWVENSKPFHSMWVTKQISLWSFPFSAPLKRVTKYFWINFDNMSARLRWMLQQTVTELFWQSFARQLKIQCTEAAIKIYAWNQLRR